VYAGTGNSFSTSVPIIIGSIPLRENFQNLTLPQSPQLQTQMPLLVPPLTGEDSTTEPSVPSVPPLAAPDGPTAPPPSGPPLAAPDGPTAPPPSGPPAPFAVLYPDLRKI